MTSNWEKLDNVSDNIKREPWSLYWREMKTGTREFEQFIHDPLRNLIGVFSGVTKTWKVHTNILNHEHGLAASHACLLALVDPEKKIIYLTIYKHREGK
jgi:hypothetical protein